MKPNNSFYHLRMSLIGTLLEKVMVQSWSDLFSKTVSGGSSTPKKNWKPVSSAGPRSRKPLSWRLCPVSILIISLGSRTSVLEPIIIRIMFWRPHNKNHQRRPNSLSKILISKTQARMETSFSRVNRQVVTRSILPIRLQRSNFITKSRTTST